MAHLRGRFRFHILKNMAQNNNTCLTQQLQGVRISNDSIVKQSHHESASSLDEPLDYINKLAPSIYDKQAVRAPVRFYEHMLKDSSMVCENFMEFLELFGKKVMKL